MEIPFGTSKTEPYTGLDKDEYKTHYPLSREPYRRMGGGVDVQRLWDYNVSCGGCHIVGSCSLHFNTWVGCQIIKSCRDKKLIPRYRRGIQ